MATNKRLYTDCVYCCSSCSLGHKIMPVCAECEGVLEDYSEYFTLPEKLKILIQAYRDKYRLGIDIKEEILKGDLPVADAHKRVQERVKGEKKIRGLLISYRFHKLIEDLFDKNPEEHLRLKIKYKPKKKLSI